MTSLKSLDLNLLVSFEAIYTAGNISHAAKQMGVTQPAMSNALTRLRKALDDPLFTQIGRGVAPTPRARQLVGPVRDALILLRDGVAEPRAFDPSKDRKHFRIVLLDQLEPVLIPPLLRQVQDHRSITIEACSVFSTPIVAGLNDGSIDLALTVFLKEALECECETVGTADVVVVARTGHPGIDGELTRVHLSTLGHVALVPQLRALSNIDEALHHNGIDRHIVYTVEKFWAMPHILARTDLIALLPGDFAREAAKLLPLTVHKLPIDMPEQNLFMTWKQSRTQDPAHYWLRGEILKAYADSLGLAR